LKVAAASALTPAADDRKKDWPPVPLGDLFQVKHGFAFKGEFFEDSGDELVLTPGNFKIGGGLQIRDGKERYYSGTPPSEFVLDPGDLLVAMTDLTQGAPILGIPIVIPPEGRFLHNQRLGKVVDLDESRLDRTYAYYLFIWDGVRARLRATATGATVRHTAPSRIYSVEVALPPLSIQQRIVAILSAYDDLIENNNRRIKILEEMAQRVYREWFVDFRYPGHENVPLVKSELGSIPEGWAWRELQHLAIETRAGVDPASVDPGTPYIGLEHMPEHSIAMSEWGVASEATSRKYEYTRGQILFGRIRPYFHKVVVPPVDGICSTDAIVISSCADAFWGLVLAVVSSDAFVAEAVQTSQGTKMPRANWSVLKSFPVAVPDNSLLSSFNSYMKQAVRLMHGLVMADRNLRATRDLLLPRLINGEVDVTDLRISVPELVA
jgi:type I restriction enzyme, S subunit